jgi:chemotaxis protein CheX
METTYDCVIEEIVQSIFSTMLDIDLARVDAPSDRESLMASAQIAGEWMGSAVLSMSPEVSRASAAAMLRMAEDEVTDADRKDVAAELANMIGGNLKSVLPGPSFLSLPTIIAGENLGLYVHNAELLEDVALASAAGVLRVRLFAERRRANS